MSFFERWEQKHKNKTPADVAAVVEGPTPTGAAPVYVDLSEFFTPAEGTIELIYGHVRNGKTYDATRTALRLLNKGAAVYSNYPIVWHGRDDSRNPLRLFLSLLWPGRFPLRRLSPANLHYYQISDAWAQTQIDEKGNTYRDFWAWFASRTDCIFFADEGHVLLDSYRKTYVSMEERTAVLSTGHYNRTIIIISQRPTAIQVSARGNVNIFWKCEKVLHIGSLILFRRTQFQDMVMDNVDETKPLSKTYYFLNSRIARAYDSKYLRAGLGRSQPTLGQITRANWIERVKDLRACFSKRAAPAVLLPEFPGISRAKAVRASGYSGRGGASGSNLGGGAARKGVPSAEGKTEKKGAGSILEPPRSAEEIPLF